MSTDTGAATVRPLTVEFPQADVDDLRRRLAATRLPERETVDDATQGVQLDTLAELVRYWAEDYDMGRIEERLNAVPNFVTEIDGLDIHFIHATSPHKDALPIILTHGWPGSIVEMLKVIGPLSDPTAYGGEIGDAFHVIVPSIPGYGLSGRPAETGWDPPHIARAWAQLMDRLGHERYVAQGGDWGSPVSSAMARQQVAGLLGIHINLPATVPPEVAAALASGAPAPAELSDKERAAFSALDDEDMALLDQVEQVARLVVAAVHVGVHVDQDGFDVRVQARRSGRGDRDVRVVHLAACVHVAGGRLVHVLGAGDRQPGDA